MSPLFQAPESLVENLFYSFYSVYSVNFTKVKHKVTVKGHLSAQRCFDLVRARVKKSKKVEICFTLL